MKGEWQTNENKFLWDLEKEELKLLNDVFKGEDPNLAELIKQYKEFSHECGIDRRRKNQSFRFTQGENGISTFREIEVSFRVVNNDRFKK